MNPVLILGAAGAAALMLQKPKAAQLPASTSLALIDPSERSNPKAGAVQVLIETAMSTNRVTTVLGTATAIERDFRMPKTAQNVRLYADMLTHNRNAGGNVVAGVPRSRRAMYAPILTDEHVIGSDLAYSSEIGFWNPIKAVGKLGKSIGKAASDVVRSPILKTGVGVLAVAFPAVGVPAAAAVATANVALDKVKAGQVAAAAVSKNMRKLEGRAKQGDRKAAGMFNAMRVAVAQRVNAERGLPPPRVVVNPAAVVSPASARKAAAARAVRAASPQQRAQLAKALAAGGSPTGQKLLAAVRAGKVAELPHALVVVPGRKPMRPKRVFVGKAPAGVKAQRIKGAHVVLRSGMIVTGQAVFAAV